MASYSGIQRHVSKVFFIIVSRIVNKDYGLAAGILSSGREDEAGCSPFQLIFDTCDLFVEEQSCDELGKSLADVVSVGDFIRFGFSCRLEDSFNLKCTGSMVCESRLRALNLPGIFGEFLFLVTSLLIAVSLSSSSSCTQPSTMIMIHLVKVHGNRGCDRLKR